MLSELDSFEILGRALAAARADEADAVLVSTDRNISRFANSNVHQNMSEVTADLTLRVVIGGAIGVASTTTFDAEGISRMVSLAQEAARHSQAPPGFQGLYRGGDPAPSLRTFDERTAGIAVADKARELRRMFDRGLAHAVQFAGSFTTAAMSVACANTHGVQRYCRTTAADATVIALGAKGSGYATVCGRSAADVDVAALGEEATGKATLCSNALVDLEPGPYDMIVEPAAIAEVLDWMNLITFSGQSYEDQSSFFVGNIDQQKLSARLTLTDDPLDEDFLPFPFDLEGFARKRVTLIDRGTIRTPVVDKAYADRLGIPPTGNCWHLGAPEHGTAFHLAIAPGNATREELLQSTKLGIWVTRFNYVNGLLDPRTALMTGTTRDGTFLVRDGEVVGRLPNLRWTQSMVEAFSNIEGLTAERRRISTWYNPFGGTFAPTMKVRGWNITGKQTQNTVS